MDKVSQTGDQLLQELERLRQRVKQLEEALAACSQTEKTFTEYKQAEETLRWEAGANILENISDGFLALDENLTITYLNKAAEQLLGRKSDEVLGHHLIEAFPEAAGSVFERNYTWAVKEKQALSFETYFDKKPYDNWYDVRVYPYENGISVFFQVTTERKQAAEALARHAQELARSNDELRQFTHIVSHDLQEPLRMVASYVQLLALRYKGQLDAEAHEFIDYAVSGVARMQELIKGLLEYSQVGTRGRQFEPTDCELVLQRALANLHVAVEETGTTVTYDPLPTIRADPIQLAQLMQNLIANAIKFHGEQPPVIHISARATDQEWIFSVADNGIGIEPEHKERIFEIFRRLHTGEEYPGTGIGLAICRKIVERHGGRIWVESRPGQGSTFYFTIPSRNESP